MEKIDTAATSADTAKVFLSYSRKDRERAQSIADVLRQRHFGVFKDTDDILPTEEWKGRLEQLIGEADTIVFLLSPHSIASEVCAWEVEHARSLGKRIAPIVISEVETDDIPADLARLNFIFCTERDRFQDAVDNLVSALSVDIDWIREHTRLGELARRWDSAEKPSRLLLRGQDIADSEAWRDSRPANAPLVTQQQAQLIAVSRKAASKRQQIAVLSSVIGCAAALGLALFAYLQRETAVENATIAAANAQQASIAQTRAEEQRDAAQVNQSLLLTGFAEQELKQSSPVEAALLALEAMPDKRAQDPLVAERPLVDEAQVMLRKAISEIAEDTILLSDLPDSRFAISPDKRWLVVHAPSQKAVHVLDLSRALDPVKLESELITGGRNKPRFSTDSSQFVITGGEGRAIVAQTDQPRNLTPIQFSKAYVNDVSFLKDAKQILAVDQNDQAFVIDVATNNILFQFDASVIATSQAGDRFAAFHNDRITIYDATTYAVIGKPEKALASAGDPVKRMIYNSTGSWLAAASEHRTYIVHGNTSAFHARTKPKDQSLLAFGFGPLGNWHYVTGIDGKTQIYDLDTLKQVGDHTRQKGWIFDAELAPDRSAVLTASSDSNIQLWSPNTNQIMAHLRGHTDTVLQVSFIDNGRGAVSLSEDGTLRRWSLARWLGGSIDESVENKIQGYLGAPVFPPDRSIMALSEAGVFDVESGDEITLNETPGLIPNFRRFSDDGRWLLAMMVNMQTGKKSDACLYEIPTGRVAHCVFGRSAGFMLDADMDGAAQIITFKEIVGDDYDRHFVAVNARTSEEIARKVAPYSTRLESAVVGPEGKRLFLQNANHKIDVFDRNFKQISSFGPDEGGVKLRFSADRRHVAFIWPAAGDVEIWNTDTETRLSKFNAPHPDRDATVFSPSGQYLTVMLSASELGVYTTSDGERIATVQIKAEGRIENPVFSADETLMAANLKDRIAILDLNTRRIITELHVNFRGFAPLTFGKKFIEEANRLIAWSWDGPTTFSLLRDPQKAVETVQKNVPRCLSPAQRKRFYLPPAPPRWCITGFGAEQAEPAMWLPKHPFGAKRWRDWLIAHDKGEPIALPE